MGVIDSRVLGILVMALFTLQGAFVLLCPGSFRLQRPQGGAAGWIYNIVNLTTVLVLTPVAAALLIKGVTGPLDATGLGPCPPLVAALLGWAGLAAFAAGNVIMYWGRVTLGRSFRIGAVPPAGSDRLVTRGPYRCVRHPMYTAVIAMPLGLGMLLQSYVFLAAALVTLLSVVRLIPIEEAQLVSAYGGEYERYRDRTRRLLPLVY